MPVLNRLWEHWYAYQGKTKTKRSVKWLADGVGISTPTLRHYLDNTTRSYDPEVIDKLCDLLNIPIEAFFYRADHAVVDESMVMAEGTSRNVADPVSKAV